MEAWRFRVSGRVQGVGFRWFVRQNAQALGVSGWVRNALDGGVEGEAAGDGTALAAFERALKQGPAFARVEGFERQDIDPATVNAGFEIRH